jgi:tetratricopeptide (TPR) repeat protein/predicted MPP superfamily phosphohydrolase
MAFTWLHVSDFHFREGDPYDRDVVLKALVASVRRYRDEGRRADLIFATGDVAFSGKPKEYELATRFFDDLLAAAGLKRPQLFVVPGNHDVDRAAGRGLARTLETREESDGYFDPAGQWFHLRAKQAAFKQWFDEYFKGVRTFPDKSTCGPVEVVTIGDAKLGVLPINSALFCLDDTDHEKLWVGRRCLGAALSELKKLAAPLNVALMHHPLDWLNGIEGPNIKVSLQEGVDFVLRGHLHSPDIESVVSVGGGNVRLAAGAAYDTRRFPNRAFYCRVEGGTATLFPIRYEDQPHEVWTVDPSLFPDAAGSGYEKSFPIPRLSAAPPSPAGAAAPTAAAASTPRFRSNVPSRRNLPFVGREEELAEILKQLGDPLHEQILVLRGPPGSGKSELAREFARRQRDRYPGGTFFIDASADGAPIDLARIGKDILDLDFPADLPLQDQCLTSLYAICTAPTLLIYDNVREPEGVKQWLPPAGAPAHVLITTCVENWAPGWACVSVYPLPRDRAVELVDRLAGPEVAAKYGPQLAEQSGGLPVQICPVAAALAYEARRGRLAAAEIGLSDEADASFRSVYDRLDAPAQLLLHAAAHLNPQRIARAELARHLQAGAGWDGARFERQLDACMDLHLLAGDADLRMHQLFAEFTRGPARGGITTTAFTAVRDAQAKRFVEVANDLKASPANTELAAVLLAYPLSPNDWGDGENLVPIDEGEMVGRALYEIGRFAEAQPWFERAVVAKERGDEHERVDHASLGNSLHAVGYCLSSRGQFAEAQPWFERAVAAAEQGDVHGRVDHASLGISLHQVGYCLGNRGQFEKAQTWHERAVAATEKGNRQGRVDHASLGISLHAVGYCLSSLGQSAEAQPWFERAVAAAEQGDVHGRVDHESLGRSLHEVGICLSRRGQFAEAQPWYERAVAAAEQGDVHGRVDHDSLGTSLHEVGYCLSRQGQFAAAQPWFERAVAAKEQGDVHGRVDHDSLGRSLHQVGDCLSSRGQFAEAQPWFERAVAAERKGDIFGRVDRASLAKSLRRGAENLRKLGRDDDAAAWEKEAAELDGAGGTAGA